MLIKFAFSHSFLKYPLESQFSLGLDRRGCFEPPSETEPPNTGIDCPDILPIGHPANITNMKAMEDDSQMVHPDCATMQRYVMGTRLQTKVKKKQHKLPTCDFHDLDKSKQGADLKTMSQGKDLLLTSPKFSCHLNPCANLIEFSGLQFPFCESC